MNPRSPGALFASRSLATAWYAGARVVAAALKIEATTLNEATPGVRIRAIQPVRLWYYDGRVSLPKGAELIVEGWHNPSGDEMLGYSGLGLPDPKGQNSPVNLRVRVTDNDGNELVLTTSELEASFVTVRPQKQRLLDETMEMPGESVLAPATPEMRSIGPDSGTNYMRAPKPAQPARTLSQPLLPGETGDEPTQIKTRPAV